MTRPLLLAGLAAGVCAAGIEVSIDASGRIDLQAKSASLSSVLECLAARTGMNVQYDAPTNQRVSSSLKGQTLPEIVLRVLEGSGLNYAIGFDPSGTGIKTLLISGPTAASGGRKPSQPEPSAHPNPPAAVRPSPPEDNPILTPPDPNEVAPPETTPAFPETTPAFPVPPSQPVSPPSQPLFPVFPEARPLTPAVMRLPL